MTRSEMIATLSLMGWEPCGSPKVLYDEWKYNRWWGVQSPARHRLVYVEQVDNATKDLVGWTPTTQMLNRREWESISTECLERLYKKALQLSGA